MGYSTKQVTSFTDKRLQVVSCAYPFVRLLTKKITVQDAINAVHKSNPLARVTVEQVDNKNRYFVKDHDNFFNFIELE